MFDPGNYTITFSASDGNSTLQKTMNLNVYKAPEGSIVFISADRGCIGETISFKAEANKGDAPITSYQWIYGDGVKGSGQSSSHKYNYANSDPGYPLVLEVTDGNNCTIKTYKYVPISGKPKISIVPGSFYICDSSSVYFNSEVISDTYIKSYQWNFGDGSSAAIAEPGIHKYNSAGKYRVTLKAIDINGCTNSEDTTISIFNVKADINVPDSVCEGDSINFRAIKSDGKFYEWIINNKTILKDSFKMSTTAFDSVYVKLHVSNEYCNAYDSALIRVSSIQAKFKMDTTWVCKFPHEVKFTDGSTGNVKNYFWDFGDGQTSIEKNPKHTFHKASFIKLKATSNAGCISESIQELSLRRPKPVIILSDSGGCLPIRVTFRADSSRAISAITSYSWKVENGTFLSNSMQINFNYSEPIRDTVKLTITDLVCGPETEKFIFEAGNKPIVDFICADTFNITSTNKAINISQPSDSIDFYKWVWNGSQSFTNNLKWKPYMDTAYFDMDQGTFVTKRDFPRPGSKIKIGLEAQFYTCPDSINKTVTMQGPVAEINKVFKTSCQLPTEINLDYKIYDAYKVVYTFENLKGGPGIKDSIQFSKDTTIRDTITRNLVPGFYKLHISAHKLKNQNPHHITYSEWTYPTVQGDYKCEKRDIVIPVANKVKADFTFAAAKVCWNGLTQFDASSSENAVLNEWYTSLNEEKPKLIYPYYAPSLTKNEPLICAANPALCSLSSIYNSNPSQPCEPDINRMNVDSAKTNIVLCNRGLYDIILVSTAANGCTDTLRKKEIIRVFKPESILTSDDARVCLGNEITFSLQGTVEDTTITTYDLYFGDNGNRKLSSKTELVKRRYTEGIFMPFINLRDAFGCETNIMHQTSKNGNWKTDYVVTSDPHATIITEGVSCKDHSLFVASDSGFIQYNWDFGDNNKVSTINNSTNHTYTSPGEYNFTLEIKDSISCPDTVKRIITVLPEPVFKVTVDTPYIGCPIAIITAEDVSGNQNIVQRTWTMKNSSMDVEMPVIATPSSIIVMPVIYPGIYNISLEINSAYCGIYSSTFPNIFRMNGPFMKMKPIEDNYCRSDSVLFAPDSSSFFNDPVFKQWNFVNNDSGKTFFSDSIVTKKSFDEAGRYTINLFYSDTLGCEMTDTSSFNIYKLRANFSIPEPICDVPKILELKNLSEGYDSLIWKMGNISSGLTDYTDTIQNYGKYALSLEVFDTTGCYDRKDIIIAAYQRPKAITSQNDTTICSGDTTNLKTYYDPAYHYEWLPSSHIIDPHVYNPKIYTDENTTFIMNVTDTVSSCTSSDTVEVYVQKVPEITYEYYYLPYGANQMFSLQNNNKITIPLGDSIRFFITTNQNNILYLWENNDGLLDCLNCQNPALRVMKHSLVIVTPSDSLHCYSSQLAREFEIIPVQGQILMPTAFSPNGDNVNDILKVEGPGLEKLIYLRIYNYSGNLLFETTKLSEGWDGKYKGKEMQSGVYFYRVKARIFNDSHEYEKEGAIKLVK